MRRALVLFVGSLVGLALVPTVGVPSATSSPVIVENSLILIGTPDEPFSGGRYFNLTEGGADILTQEVFMSTFRRTSDTDLLWDDPRWLASVDPTVASPGTFELDRDSTVFRLGRDVSDGTEWMGESCPDLTGEVHFQELTLDESGIPSSLSAWFELHCAPYADDVLYGTFVFEAALPSLPDAAMDLIAADAAYPNVMGGEAVWFSNPDDWEGLIARADGDNVLLRWDAKRGFECAALFTDESGSQTVMSYLGRDDTITLADLDPTHLYEFEVYFGNAVDPGGDQCLDMTGNAKIFFTPLEIDTTALPEEVSHGDSARVHGTVRTVLNPYVNVAENVHVKVYATDGFSDTLVGQTRTDANGRWSVEFPADKVTDLQVVVPEGRAGWGRSWAHFGTTAEAGTLRVSHDVRAAVQDTTVRRQNTAVVTARLLPVGDTTPIYLERLSREGAWIRVDTQITKPGETTHLSVPSVRRGWQALRVVAPGDGWHTRDVSNRVRVYGY